jgi:putative transposase
MPRARRTWTPGTAAHTISRFVDRRYYLSDDLDRRALFESIDRANDRWDWTWLSYAVMSSHLHYGHIAGSDPPERFLRSAHTRFAGQYHRRRDHQTLGPVFANRPDIYDVPLAKLARLVAYHHRNPVTAGVVERPSQSTWTSHRAYLRLDPAPRWLDVERALHLVGFSDTAAGRRRFDSFVMDVDLDALPFEVPTQVATRVAQGERPDVDWARLLRLARQVMNLPTHERLASRARRAVKTRRLIALVATRDFGQTYASVGAELGMHAGSVFNVIVRQGGHASLETELAELRRRLARNDENDEVRPRLSRLSRLSTG